MNLEKILMWFMAAVILVSGLIWLTAYFLENFFWRKIAQLIFMSGFGLVALLLLLALLVVGMMDLFNRVKKIIGKSAPK